MTENTIEHTATSSEIIFPEVMTAQELVVDGVLHKRLNATGNGEHVDILAGYVASDELSVITDSTRPVLVDVVIDGQLHESAVKLKIPTGKNKKHLDLNTGILSNAPNNE